MTESVGKIGPHDVQAAAPSCCGSCPWRLELQENPSATPIPAAEVEGFYTLKNREAMWWRYPSTPKAKEFAGMGDGMRMVCHATLLDSELKLRESPGPRVCRGGQALQERAFIRYCMTGVREPLRGMFAGRIVLAGMLGIKGFMSIVLYGPWEVRGEPLTFARVLDAALPAVFDPGVGSELVPAVTEAEHDLWRGVAADPDWKFPAGSPVGPVAR